MTASAKGASMASTVETIREKARLIRIHSLRATTAAGSGHPTSCCSAAELLAGVFFHAMRFDPKNPNANSSDRFVLSKGHAAPGLYAALAEAGVFPVSRLMTLRQFSSELEGHPTPLVPGVDAATGSLGQGLSVGVGLALGQRLEGQSGVPSAALRAGEPPHSKTRVYVLLGDGEMAEGNVWEAAAFAAHYKLDNLTAIVDVNALGQSERTMYKHDTEPYRRKFEAHGWQAEVIDGHDAAAVIAALDRAKAASGRPQAIIARTEKGHGVSFLADKDGWHGKPLSKDDLQKALAELAPLPEVKPDEGRSYARTKLPAPADFPAPAPPDYKPGQAVATREAYGTALKKLAAVNPKIVAVDGDVKNSTFAEWFGNAYPERFFQGYIAEQNMVGVGVGLCATGHTAFVASFACFLSRAYDQVRMAGVTRSYLNLCGSHCGVSIGEDGPSQMGLEDLAMFRAVPGSVVLYPSDAVATERLTEAAARMPGISYIRTTRPKTPVLYGNDEAFPIPGFKVLRRSENDRAVVVTAGVTLIEALKAHDELKAKGVNIRVIDLYCVKPIDGAALAAEVRAAGGRLVTVEDHYPEGGLGEAVLGAILTSGPPQGAGPGRELQVRRLAVTGVPHSGKAEELLDAFGISAKHVAAAVEGM
jgi:transketolase